jgi:hypothetical protein
VVQLSGTISGPDQATADAARLQAQKLALATPGVREVVNNLRAVVSGGPTQSASDAPPPAVGANDSAAKMQARLAVWRERVAR